MKKCFLVLLVMLMLPGVALADEAANIRIKITGATSDNRYFLCMATVGCLSIAKAAHGKIYPMFNGLTMQPLYVTNLQNFRVYQQGLPASCNVTVEPNQTISIYGRIVSGPKDSIRIANLSCQITKS